MAVSFLFRNMPQCCVWGCTSNGLAFFIETNLRGNFGAFNTQALFWSRTKVQQGTMGSKTKSRLPSL